MKSNLALIGFMGTGKTTVGRLLAQKMERRFIETDERIAEKAGKSIPEIFEEDGETRFRGLEMEVIKEVAEMENVIISCGGGVVLHHKNIYRLRRNAVLILLTASPETILQRTSRSAERPLLPASASFEDIQALLMDRKPFYHAAVDVTIDTTKVAVDEVANEILCRVKN